MTLDELKQLLAKATPGRWYLLEPPWLSAGCETTILAGSPDPHAGRFICDFDELGAEDEDKNSSAWQNAELLCALRNSAPDLIAAVEALSGLLDEVESLDDFTVTRDIERYKAEANWEDAIDKANAVLAKFK